MMPIILRLPMPPTLNTYYRHFRNKVLISKPGRLYRKMVLLRFRRYKATCPDAKVFPIMDRLRVTVELFPPADRYYRDLDNYLKALLDSLQKARVFVNDNQIDHLEVIRRPRAPKGYILVTITPITDEPNASARHTESR